MTHKFDQTNYITQLRIDVVFMHDTLIFTRSEGEEFLFRSNSMKIIESYILVILCIQSFSKVILILFLDVQFSFQAAIEEALIYHQLSLYGTCTRRLS